MHRQTLLQTLALTALLAGWPAVTPRAVAQESADRPRVALVLGGGGARGFAHVGVLRALHEARIPVDVVVGTSMGAIVGGLYASGIPLAEIEGILETRDWPLLFDDDPPRAKIRLRRKREERELLIPFEIGVGPGGVSLPSGLLGGDKLLTLLQVYMLHSLGSTSFDDRPLPFRAVATDALTGEPVVLDRGSLARAARASASVPGVFAPIEIDGRELIDGGLVDNLPVELGRSLGADIVIAVDVGATLDDEPESALDLATRAMTIMIRRAAEDQVAALQPSDWLIVPDLEGVGSAAFSADSYQTAVAAGAAAVRADSTHRLALSVTAAEFAAWDARRTADWAPDAEAAIGDLRADTSRTSLAPGVVTGVFPFDAGDRIGREELADGVARVLGYGGFSTAGLSLEERDGAVDIELRPVDKPWGPGVLRSGLILEDRQRGRALWSLRALLTYGRLNSFGGVLKGEIQVGSEQRLRLEWYQPLDRSERFFASLRGEVHRANELIPRGDELTEGVDIGEIGAEVKSGIRLGTWGELAAGLRLARLDADRPTGSDIALPEASDVVSWLGRFEVDVLDRPAFPTRGVLVRSELELARGFLGGDERFDRLAADVVAAFSHGSHSLIVGADFGTGLGDTLRLGRDFQLGGLFRLSAAEPGSFRGSYAGLGRLIYYFRPGTPAARREGTALRLGASLETGRTWAASEDVTFGDLLIAGTLFAALDTPLGPLHAGWAWTEQRSPTWFFRIGPVF